MDIQRPPVRSSLVLCARCGHKNPDDARFCSSCGAPLTATGDDDNATTLTLSAVEAADVEDELERYLDGLAPGVGLLVVRHGPETGSSYRLRTSPVWTSPSRRGQGWRSSRPGLKSALN